MTNSTLGGLIKDYRIRKRLSQHDVSIKMGWKDTTRLSKIEQGRVVKPKRETIDKILEALELEDYEKGDFLFNAGYLPTEAEIAKALKEVKDKIDNWPFPAYLMDFSWRWFYVNDHTLKSIDYPLSWKKQVNSSRMNMLEAPFLPKDKLWVEIQKGDEESNLKPLAFAQIAAFKTENYKYQNESWYKKLVKKLSIHEEFRRLWPKIVFNDYHKKLQEYEFKRVTITKGEKKIILNFHMYTSRLISNPQLQIVFYHPADEFTSDYFK